MSDTTTELLLFVAVPFACLALCALAYWREKRDYQDAEAMTCDQSSDSNRRGRLMDRSSSGATLWALGACMCLLFLLIHGVPRLFATLLSQ